MNLLLFRKLMDLDRTGANVLLVSDVASLLTLERGSSLESGPAKKGRRHDCNARLVSLMV